jgi:hypothetical protein
VRHGSRNTGFLAHEMEAYFKKIHDAGPMRVACALCEWQLEGLAGEVLERQREHRAEHGIVKQRRGRHTYSLTRIKQRELTEEDRREIEAEIARRAFLHGVAV